MLPRAGWAALSPPPAREEQCMSRGLCLRPSGGRSSFFRPRRWPPARRAPCLPGSYSRCRCRCEYSGCVAAGTGVCAGARRPAAHCHERPDPPALSRRHLPAASAPAALGGQSRHSGRRAQRSGPRGPGRLSSDEQSIIAGISRNSPSGQRIARAGAPRLPL